MRFKLLTLTACLPVAGLLTGCAMGPNGASVANPANAAVKVITGKAFGGQQPVSNGEIVVYQYGTGGYGSSGTAIATTTTDNNGNFNVDYTCTSPTAPVYVLSIGGNPGLNLPANSAITLGAALGTCSASESSYVTINEISTTVLAFSLSHFFSSATSDGTTSDHFGSPADLNAAVARTNDVLIPTLISVTNGYPNQSSATFTNESAKIITLADILGACVNSSGPSSPACTNLFSYATPSGGTAPADTLQAAVDIALNPAQNVALLYGLVPPSGSSAFAGSLTTQPNDWTIAVSYQAPGLGLGADNNTQTTLDIDTSGRVWFPVNLPGSAGVAYFDPGTSSFSSAFTAPGLVRPEQVAIDINGEVWATDLDSANIAGFPGATPGTPVILSIPGTTSTAVTVNDDDSLRVAVVSTATNEPEFAEVTNGTSYTLIPNTTPAQSQSYIGASLAGDLVGGTGVSGTDLSQPNVYDLYLRPNNTEQGVLFSAFADSGQIGFTGADFVTALGGFNAAGDGICIFSRQSCFKMADQSAVRHPTGLAVDGGGNLWLADSYTLDVQKITKTGSSYLNGGSQAPNQVYMHGTNNGATMTGPNGIGIDNTGDVWVSNISCIGVGCTPTATYTLSEIIGAGVPTINPVSAQVVLNSAPGVEPSFQTATSGTKH